MATKEKLILGVIFIHFILMNQAIANEIKISEFSGFNLLSGNEETISLEKKHLVALFLNRSCPCSQAHFDHLNKLSKKYKNFLFVGLHSNKNTNQQTAMSYYQKFKVDFPIFEDKSLQFANAFNALKTPHVFVVNPEGKIEYQGGATDSRNPKRAQQFYLQKALEEISQGKPVSNPITKTLGCYIQR